MSDEKRRHNDTGADAERDGGDDSALTLVESLMAERRKYEQWLAALEARRATTPERVFNRVHADYHDRLDAVIEQLKEHTEGLRAELASLTLRLTAVDEEQQQRYDERAEAELRAHVGELSGEAWDQIAHEADRSIEALTAKHTELERERSKTRELLTEAERPSPARGAATIAAAPAAPVPAAVASRPAPAAAPPAPAAAAARTAAPSAAAEVPRVAPAPRPAPSVAEPPAAPPPPVVAAEARVVEPTMATPEVVDADVTPRPTQRADASRLSGEINGAFDELAFLKSVAEEERKPAPGRRSNPGAGAPVQASRAVETPAAPSSAKAGAFAPAAMDPKRENDKTLKCAECGAMNYPTEWYCESCGGELSAL